MLEETLDDGYSISDYHTSHQKDSLLRKHRHAITNTPAQHKHILFITNLFCIDKDDRQPSFSRQLTPFPGRSNVTPLWWTEKKCDPPQMAALCSLRPLHHQSQSNVRTSLSPSPTIDDRTWNMRPTRHIPHISHLSITYHNWHCPCSYVPTSGHPITNPVLHIQPNCI